MHVLGHSFSQKCKRSKRPRDLRIRKVSFSGSSLSGCSLSSSDSTASACTVIHPSHTSILAAAPSIDHAPLRLHERAYKDGSHGRPQHLGSYFDDDDDEAIMDDLDEESGSDSDGDDSENLPHFEMEMPPHAGEQQSTNHDRYEPTDYFAIQLARRPPMPRSRWSESTIQSVQTIDAITTPGSVISTAASEQEEDQGPPVVVEVPPNFSYKRAVSTPAGVVSPAVASGRRPPMKTMDSIDEFVKRGGWKRRGVVFKRGEVDPGQDRYSH